MKKRKNILDEMQEQRMLQIEHNGFWLAYFGLAVTIVGQAVYYGRGSMYRVAGEFIVFMCLSAYLVIASIKNDIWDRHFEPTWKVNLCAGVIAAVVGGFFQFLIEYHDQQDGIVSFQKAVRGGIYMGVTCMLLLSAAALIFRKRQERFEKDEESDEEEQ